ncbi:MAG: hypothetical protein ACQXXD_01610 [Thermoplasmatota archaeon]
MAKKMKAFVRTATKSTEKNLVENAKKLKENPHILLPDCADDYSKKYFNKIRKNLDKIYRFRDDVKKLEKLSKKRGLDGALAGTLLIAHSEKAPYLAVAQFPSGDVTYAQRGKADKEKLVAVQHFDDPMLRLLGFKDIAMKKKLHVYSWDKGFVSTGLKPSPPDGFVDFIINKTGLSNQENVLVCNHIPAENAKNKDFIRKNYLRIHWKSADTLFAICEDCTKSTDNTIFRVTKYLLESNLSDDFQIEVVGQVVKQTCLDIQQKTLYLDEYLSGKINDNEFIRKNLEEREKAIKTSKEKILVLDGVSYGRDVKGFIEALKPNKYERIGLEFILKQVEEPVVLNNVTPNKVLECFWKKYGLDVIRTMIDNEDVAKDIFSLNDTPSNTLEMAFNYKERQDILSRLPRYSFLPPLAKFADHIARTYKAFGEEKALGEIKKRSDDPKVKSLAYAFLLVFQKEKDKKWQYSNIEIEYGEFLKDYARKLLDSKPEDYHNILSELLVASGSSEVIKPDS